MTSGGFYEVSNSVGMQMHTLIRRCTLLTCSCYMIQLNIYVAACLCVNYDLQGSWQECNDF